MTERIAATVANQTELRAKFTSAWEWARARIADGHRLSFEVKKATRSSDQNNLMWSVLTDLSRQVRWPVDGTLQTLEPDEWKDVLSAGVTKAQRVAQGIEGGWVMLGQRTSKMTVAEMSALITFAHAFGDQKGVRWSRTSLGRDAPEEAFA